MVHEDQQTGNLVLFCISWRSSSTTVMRDETDRTVEMDKGDWKDLKNLWCSIHRCVIKDTDGKTHPYLTHVQSKMRHYYGDNPPLGICRETK